MASALSTLTEAVRLAVARDFKIYLTRFVAKHGDDSALFTAYSIFHLLQTAPAAPALRYAPKTATYSRKTAAMLLKQRHTPEKQHLCS